MLKSLAQTNYPLELKEPKHFSNKYYAPWLIKNVTIKASLYLNYKFESASITSNSNESEKF